MTRTVLYILIPCALVFGAVYFFFFKPPKVLSPADFVLKTDRALIHVPHVFKTITEDENKSVFQHLLHLEGVDELSNFVHENADLLEKDYLSNLTFILTENYKFVLILDESKSSFSEKFWDSLIQENGYKIIKTNNGSWFFRRAGDFILCSNDAEQLKRSNTTETWDFSTTNWNHGFVKFNPSLFSQNDSYGTTDFLLSLSDERINLSGYHKTQEGAHVLAKNPLPFDMEYYLPLELNRAHVKMLTLGSSFLKGVKSETFPDGFNAEMLDNARLAKFNFRTNEGANASVFVIKTEKVFNLSKEVFGLKNGRLSKSSNSSFLEITFTSLYETTDQPHAYQTGEILVLGDEISVLAYKKILERNAVWAYSLDRMKWLEEELIPSNEYEISRSLFLLNSLNKDTIFTNYLERNSSVLESLPYIVSQKSYEGNGLYAGMSVVLDDEISTGYNTTDGLARESVLLTDQEIAQLPSKLNSKPFSVKSHADKRIRFVLTDKENRIYLVNQSGEEEWSFSLDGKLISEIKEVDLFKNRKVQYVFATDKKVYCVDRLGRMVEKFPITLENDAPISSFTLVDYDKSRNYRFALTSGKNVWLFNSKGESLEGWNPLEAGSTISSNLEHVRIGTKDYLVLQEIEGKVSLFHRNGNLYEGSPFSVSKSLVKNSLNIKTGEVPEESYLTFLTTKGRLLKYNFLGEKMNEEGLSQSSGFDSMFVQNKRTDFRYFVIKGNAFEVYDEKYVRKYKNNTFKDVFAIQSYSLSGVDLYAVFHASGMTLVSAEDKIIMDNVSTKEPITLYYSRSNRQGYFYFVSKNKLLKSTFNL